MDSFIKNIIYSLLNKRLSAKQVWSKYFMFHKISNFGKNRSAHTRYFPTWLSKVQGVQKICTRRRPFRQSVSACDLADICQTPCKRMCFFRARFIATVQSEKCDGCKWAHRYDNICFIFTTSLLPPSLFFILLSFLFLFIAFGFC